MMKKFMFIFLVTIILSGNLLKAQTKADSMAIEKACREYVEGWAEGNTDRVGKGVYNELVKRTIRKDIEGVSFTDEMSASMLKALTKRNKDGNKAKDLEPGKPFKLSVIIFDIAGDFAMAKTLNTKYGFFDYCQLAKFNGEWKIINVLWGWLPEKK